MKLYVGNFAYTMTESQLKDLFSPYGEVLRAIIITDHYTRQSKCFGYVDMASRGGGGRCIEELHGKVLNKRPLVVKEARTRDERRGLGW